MADKSIRNNYTNELTKTIINHVESRGYQAERVLCMGAPYPVGNGTYRMKPTTMDRGTADIHCTVRGLSVKIEVKAPGDRMSSFQHSYKNKIESAGGVYYVAQSMENFKRWFEYLESDVRNG